VSKVLSGTKVEDKEKQQQVRVRPAFHAKHTHRAPDACTHITCARAAPVLMDLMGLQSGL